MPQPVSQWMMVLATSPSKLPWRKSISGAAASARADNYRLHVNGHRDISSYRVNPFVSLGRQKSVPESMTVCAQHSEAYDASQSINK
jgi:hypothetical protein